MSAIDRLGGLVEAVAIKAPCAVATTANITLSGLQTIDAVVLAGGERVLVWNQTDATQNGIYVADSGNWTRDVDFNGTGDCVQGTIVMVVSGTLYGNTVFEQTAASPVIGTSAITFAVAGAAALALASSYMRTSIFPLTTAAAVLAALGTSSNATLAATYIAKALLTTKGDTVAATGNATPARVGVGANGTVLMARSAATPGVAYVSPFGAIINGLTYANNGTDSLDIVAGGCMDATGAYWIQLAAITKQTNVVWAVGTGAGGLDTGVVGNSDYYIWAIARSDTGVTDVLTSLSSTAPTMPANYDFKRLIGWFKRSGGAVVGFKTYETEGGGIDFAWSVPTLDINLSNTLTTTRRTDAVKVPLNLSTIATLNVTVVDASAVFGAWICCPDQTDAAASFSTAPLGNISDENTSANGAMGQMVIRTDATGKIAARATIATVDLYAVSTMGFRWSRR